MRNSRHPSKLPCPCCGFATLSDFDYWSYEVCPVCFWENDPVQKEDDSYAGGANGISLFEARENFIRIGASCSNALAHVRPPQLDEMPPLSDLIGVETDQRKAAVRIRKAHIRAVIGAMRQGVVPSADGCLVMAMLASALSESEGRRDLRMFEIIVHQLDDFPVGTVRRLWSSDALARKDAELREYEPQIRDQINGACDRADQFLINELETT